MNAVSEQRESIEPAPRAPDPNAPRVRTLLICDLADSTALVERLGDAAAAELFRRHDRAARDLLQRFRGREIDKTDGFLALFDRPIEAVGFALHYQRALRSLVDDPKRPLRARVGIHVGEVVLWENTRAEIESGAKPLEVEGLAKPVVARLMALAVPGQILLSGIAFSLAQRAEKELDDAARLRWLTHGRYHFKGVPAPMLVHEVGEAGFAPLQAPPSGPKAARDVPLWRRPGVLALEALALLAAIAVPAWLSLRAPPAIAFGERDWVVMGELRNLTGETLLDDSLETAFRISLEQSRHVNVLPDLKLRDALARMQRPADTAIDRGVASEIALREGARAVILPTVAEVGGRVRVSAEVIDPNSQTTVYAESADGIGAASTLDSIDAVTRDLRARLGEAISAIEQSSSPLPKVTSADLDALRAYSVGVKHFFDAHYAEALASFDHALGRDPAFALAHIGRARVHYTLARRGEARAALAEAQRHRGRLTARDALYLDAWGTIFGATEDKLRQWKLLGQMYPDYFAAHYNYAMFALLEAGKPAEALRSIEAADVWPNPYRAESIYLKATTLLASNRVEEALRVFHESVAMQPTGGHHEYAFAHAANGAHDRAREVLAAGVAPGSASQVRRRREVDLALLVDEGRLEEAMALDQGPDDLAGRLEDDYGNAGRTLIGLSLAVAATGATDARARLQRAAAALAVDRPDESGDAGQMRDHRRLVVAYLAARQGMPELARQVLAGVSGQLDTGAALGPAMREVAEAEVLRASGDGQAALTRLDALLRERELFPARAARLRALRDLGRNEEARIAARALAAARGPMFVGDGVVAQTRVLNLVDGALASLDAAELSARLGDGAGVQADLARFRARWHAALALPAIAARVAAAEATPR